MNFNSVVFLFCFMPLALGLYYLVPGRVKNAVLLVVCCVCSTQLPGRFWQCCKGKAPLRAALCGVCFVLCTAYVVAATGSTALYANF